MASMVAIASWTYLMNAMSALAGAGPLGTRRRYGSRVTKGLLVTSSMTA
jgi:hypothetical protein